MVQKIKVVRYLNLTDDTSFLEDVDGNYWVGSQGSDPILTTEEIVQETIDEVGGTWEEYECETFITTKEEF